MQYAPLVDRIAGERADAWAIHFAATDAKRRGEDVILLSIGDPDFSTPDFITGAAIAALKAGDTHYADVPGRPGLRQAIAAKFQSRTGVPTGPQNVIVLGGAQNALFATAQVICEAGTDIVALEPVYLTYEATIRATGANLILAPQPAAADFSVDFAALRRAITANTRALFFATPNNPTGHVMSRAELAGIAELAKQHDLWVVVDEVYCELVFEGEHISLASLPGMAERTITISSLSKSHAMTGWRSGWAIGPAEFVTHVDRLSLAMLYGLPGFIQEGARVAIEQGDGEVARMRDLYRRRRDLVVSHLSRLNVIDCRAPRAGMFMMLGVERTGLSARDFAWGLFKETGVALLDASPFGPSARGFLRMSFTIGEAELEEACRRIARYTAGLGRNAARVS